MKTMETIELKQAEATITKALDDLGRRFDALLAEADKKAIVNPEALPDWIQLSKDGKELRQMMERIAAKSQAVFAKSTGRYQKWQEGRVIRSK
ncbi:MAG: hypothetical protein ABSB41_03980 [Anaerolineales bacterium]|jgi:hypothetical protein